MSKPEDTELEQYILAWLAYYCIALEFRIPWTWVEEFAKTEEQKTVMIEARKAVEVERRALDKALKATWTKNEVDTAKMAAFQRVGKAVAGL